MAPRSIEHALTLDPRSTGRGWLRWLALLLLLGCGGQEAMGQANVVLCRSQRARGCEEGTGDHLVVPALFSRTWSRFENRGVAVMVHLAVDAGDGTTRGALLWLDVDLGRLVPGEGGGLGTGLWEAEYSEHLGEQTLFAGRSVEGSVVVSEQLLLDGQPPALKIVIDLEFHDHDGAQVSLSGVLSTDGSVRDLDGSDQRPRGYTDADDEYYCYDCRYGCGGVYIEDSYDDDGGCGGEDSSSSSDTGGGCEGDTTDSSYDSGGGCEGDSSDSGGCEGDAQAAAVKTPRRRLPGLSLPRLLDLAFPILIGVLLRRRRRRP